MRWQLSAERWCMCISPAITEVRSTSPWIIALGRGGGLVLAFDPPVGMKQTPSVHVTHVLRRHLEATMR